MGNQSFVTLAIVVAEESDKEMVSGIHGLFEAVSWTECKGCSTNAWCDWFAIDKLGVCLITDGPSRISARQTKQAKPGRSDRDPSAFTVKSSWLAVRHVRLGIAM